MNNHITKKGKIQVYFVNKSLKYLKTLFLENNKKIYQNKIFAIILQKKGKNEICKHKKRHRF